MVSAEKGVSATVRAIESERTAAKVLLWPWVPVGLAMRCLPLSRIARMA